MYKNLMHISIKNEATSLCNVFSAKYDFWTAVQKKKRWTPLQKSLLTNIIAATLNSFINKNCHNFCNKTKCSSIYLYAQ